MNYTILCLVTAITTETSSWTLDVPSSIKGLPGYCVVIPCSFNFPNSKKELTQFTGVWYNSRNQVIYHPVESKIMQKYRNRTALLGNLSQKNCSLEIDPLNDHDKGPFHFRVVITGLDSYSYIHEKVSISMISKSIRVLSFTILLNLKVYPITSGLLDAAGELDPVSLSVSGEVRDDRNASVRCSVTHSCPTSPPDFTWSHRGRAEVQHTKLDDGHWRSASTLTFRPSRENHNQSLRCSVRYKGGRTQEATELLRVSCEYESMGNLGKDRKGKVWVFFLLFFTDAPEIRKTSYCISGAKWMTCVCIVESSPPSGVQFVLSDGISNSTDVKTNGTITIGVLQTEPGPHQFIHCLANNTLGRANLTLSMAHSKGFLKKDIFVRFWINGRQCDEHASCPVIGQVGGQSISLSSLLEEECCWCWSCKC